MKNKDLFFKISSPIAGSFNLNTLVANTQKTLFLPFYHTVSNHSLAHISNLYSVPSIARFEKQLDDLLKYFKPIDFNDLQAVVLNGQNHVKPSFHLTFDDGLRELQTIIAPILLRKGIPATFFVCPAFVDNKTLFYRHLVSICLGVLSTSSLKNKVDLSNRLKQINYANREELNDIATQLNVSDRGYLMQEQPYLTSNEIITLDKQGFTIGAHSYDHPLYEKLSLQEQLTQTSSSIEYVSTIINKKVEAFSFPFTDHNVSSDFFRQLSKKYPSLISFGTAGLQDEPSNPFHLQRFPMEVYDENTISLLKKEYLYYLFKKIMRKNIIARK